MRCCYFLLLISLINISVSNAEDFKVKFPQKDTVYMIQVGKELKSTEINRIRDKIKSLNSDKDVLFRFKAPYQYAFIGYFKSKKEAEEFQESIKEDFPNTLIIPSVPSKN